MAAKRKKEKVGPKERKKKISNTLSGVSLQKFVLFRKKNQKITEKEKVKPLTNGDGLNF